MEYLLSSKGNLLSWRKIYHSNVQTGFASSIKIDFLKKIQNRVEVFLDLAWLLMRRKLYSQALLQTHVKGFIYLLRIFNISKVCVK